MGSDSFHGAPRWQEDQGPHSHPQRHMLRPVHNHRFFHTHAHSPSLTKTRVSYIVAQTCAPRHTQCIQAHARIQAHPRTHPYTALVACAPSCTLVVTHTHSAQWHSGSDSGPPVAFFLAPQLAFKVFCSLTSDLLTFVIFWRS